MIIYHRGTAIQTSVTQARNTFIARAAIFEEDSEETSLGNLGAFASRECALQFAVMCATVILSRPLTYAPGTQFNYDSYATHLLSIVLARATGRTLDRFA